METKKNAGCTCNFGIGAIIAGILSWITNQSVLYCIGHVILGWLYVIYWLIAYKIMG